MAKEDNPEEGAAAAQLRPVEPEDDAFLLKAYESVRAEEMARVPWNEFQRTAFLKMQFDAQQLHYRTHNPNSTHDIILLKDEPVGRLYVSRREEEIRILDITVLPEYRNQGVGTQLLEGLKKEAAATGKPLTIYVERFNPSLRLFERLGFLSTEEDEVNLLMGWRPSEA
jgi:GNAT superfamily N-acetyltransferase